MNTNIQQYEIWELFTISLFRKVPSGNVTWILHLLKVSVFPFIPQIKFRRRPYYYVFNMILPCGFVSLVALLTFFLPPESGEKISLGITVLLSLTVFLLLVAETMPPTSAVPVVGKINVNGSAVLRLQSTVNIFQSTSVTDWFLSSHCFS